MSSQLMMPQMDNHLYSVTRAFIIDALHDKSARDLEDDSFNAIKNWKKIEDPSARRSAKHLALLLEDNELRSLIKNGFTFFKPYEDVDDTDNDEIRGGVAPLVAFLIAVAASVVGAGLWAGISSLVDSDEESDNDPNCVGKVKEYIEGHCYQFCIDEFDFKNGEPYECDGGGTSLQ